MYIELKNVSKKIKGIDILDDVSLRMESGKIYGFRGKNGSGKTMLMRAIAGLIKVTGTVDIDGKILGKDEMFPPSIGILIENPSFISNYTGFENLKTLASIRERIDDNKIRQTLTEVGLEPDDKRTFKKYSLGMKQRLGIAAAIMEDPDIIILDEPINALDDSGTEQVRQIICAAAGTAPAYMGNDSDFYTIVSQFESVYEIYGEFQRKMERFWSLKWIEQEGLKEIEAVVIKGDLVRVEGLPLVQRIPGMPELDRGRKVLLGVLGFDYIDVLFEGKLLAVLDETDEEALEEGDGLEEESEAVVEPQAAEATEQNAQVTEQSPETVGGEAPSV